MSIVKFVSVLLISISVVICCNSSDDHCYDEDQSSLSVCSGK